MIIVVSHRIVRESLIIAPFSLVMVLIVMVVVFTLLFLSLVLLLGVRLFWRIL